VPEVVRHLVDEERLILAVSARVRHVAPAEPAEIFRRKLGKQARAARLQLEDDALDVGELLSHRQYGIRV